MELDEVGSVVAGISLTFATSTDFEQSCLELAVESSISTKDLQWLCHLN